MMMMMMTIMMAMMTMMLFSPGKYQSLLPAFVAALSPKSPDKSMMMIISMMMMTRIVMTVMIL